MERREWRVVYRLVDGDEFQAPANNKHEAEALIEGLWRLWPKPKYARYESREVGPWEKVEDSDAE